MTTSPRDPRYQVGSLQYTRAGLATLFAWILWGDFCFTLMEAVLPSILPLRLKELEAPNLVLSLIVSTVPSGLNTLLNPFISFRSDRLRSRWGRRIPFLVFATPFLALTLAVMGFSTDLGALAHRILPLKVAWWSSASATILVIGVLMVAFQFFNMFANTVFWYLFNDVVPQAFMARFLAMCRIVGGAAGATYNYFIFQHALTHMREIFVGAALLYFGAFMLMCWRVKEGDYPPPAPNVGGKTGFWASARTYVVECMGDRIYRFYFAASACGSLANALAIFSIFLPLSMGVTLGQVGKLNAVVGVAAMLMSYPAGALADRFHPVRVLFWISVLVVAQIPLNLIWLFHTFDPATTYHILIALAAITLPLFAINNAVVLPAMMQLFPRDRFGQFCSANAMVQSIFNITGSLLGGLFMDFLQRRFGATPLGKEWAYRLMPCWALFFLGLNLFFMWIMYRRWKRLGGRDGYVPPLVAAPRTVSGVPTPRGAMVAAETPT